MIRTRLTVWNCAVLALILAVIGVAILITTRQAVFNSVDYDLKERARFLAAAWEDRERLHLGMRGRGVRPPMERLDPKSARNQGIDPRQIQRLRAMNEFIRPLLLDLNGQDQMLPDQKAWDMTGFQGALRGQETFTDASFDGIPLRILTVPLIENGKVTAVTQLAAPLVSEQEMLERLAKTLGLVFPLAVVMMMGVGVALTKLALRPVGQIASTAGAIEASNLDGRLPVNGKDEFAHLSSTFNSMLGRLQSAFEEKDVAYERQRRFTADASHELKTPLTAIRARIGIAMRNQKDAPKLVEQVQAIDRAVTLMTSVVQDLLLLAASDENRLELEKETVQVSHLVGDAIASVDMSKHKVSANVDPALTISADAAAITRVLVNLLQNAALHTPPGKAISVQSEASDERACLIVQDEGVGIPPEQVLLVFNRFHRVDESRDRHSGGSGLGLAIAKVIVEAHRGTIALESKLGVGTRVIVCLPREI